MSANSRRTKDLLGFVLILLIIVLLNFIGKFLYYRLDLTTEKRYTLSQPTRELLKGLNDVVYFKIYLEGDFPAGFRVLRNRTKEMLEEFQALGGSNVQFEFIDPNANPDKKQRQQLYRELYEQGLQPTKLEVTEKEGESQQVIFPGAIVSFKGKSGAIQLLKSRMGTSPEQMLNNSVQDLEYELADAIRKLSKPAKPLVGFIGGHGELDSLEVYDITHTLADYYDVVLDTINHRLGSLNRYKCIVIAKPDSAWDDKDKFILDQYIMRGGKVLWLVDPVYATMDSLQSQATTFAIPVETNLEDLLFAYGVRINYNLIQDLQAAPIPITTGMIGNQPQMKFFPWFYFPIFFPEAKHPIVNNLNGIKAEFASSMDTLSVAGIKKTILLQSSKYARIQQAPTRISLNLLGVPPDESQFNKPNLITGVLLEGEFPSAFTDMIPSAIQQSTEIGFRSKSIKTAMIVVSDGDLIRNGVNRKNGTYYALGYDRYTQRDYGNKNFILNAINYLCDDSGLISARARELKLRLLDRKKVEKEKFKWQVINVALPVLLLFSLGGFLYWRRKRKYGN
ncbi:MAG: gliding motility-associated ABC transporter substrate-binding protein GldG [Bacteroidia bacterium]|nr:gliding motility-associated ABC transporter substrate-binding protein GldG [Bacteroidia bacterium]